MYIYCSVSNILYFLRGKPFTPAGSESYRGTEPHSLLQEKASNHYTKRRKPTRQDARKR
jgi:hypothetical protein